MKPSYYSSQQTQQQQQSKQIINVKLTFANKEFHGKGLTLQLAKHNAADKALEYFTHPEHFLEAKSIATSTQNESVKAYRPPQFHQQDSAKEIKEHSNDEICDLDKSNNSASGRVKPLDTKNQGEQKSEVQLVHEYAFYLKKSVDFKVIIYYYNMW